MASLVNYALVAVVLAALCVAPSGAMKLEHDPEHEERELSSLRAFVDPLPIMKVVSLDALSNITIGAFKTTHQYHQDLPPSKVYSFGTSQAEASVPGPTLVATRGTAVTVTWVNNITDSNDFLPVDFTVGAPKPKHGGVPLVAHLHGMTALSTFDGHPEAWFTALGDVGPTFATRTYVYDNTQPGAMLWYHDHTVGMTRFTSKTGLAGAYILRDPAKEQELGLPQGDRDVPLVLNDLSFFKSGLLDYPKEADNPRYHTSWLPENFGKFPIVNGKVAPILEVQPVTYRFRLLNAASARFFKLTLVLVNYNATVGVNCSIVPMDLTALSTTNGSTLNFVQVASDAGFLPRAVTLKELLIAPGQRIEALVDFSGVPPGMAVVLNNSAPVPYPSGGDDEPLFEVMLFKISNGSAIANKAQSSAPLELDTFPELNISNAVNYPQGRNVSLTELDDEEGNVLVGLMEGKHWMNKTTITPRLNTSEIWNYINLTPDAHPIHFHFLPQRLIDRRPLNVTLFSADLCNFEAGECWTGDAIGPEPQELGYHDTIISYPEMVTRVFVDFGMPSRNISFDPTQGPGYVIHCHILDHEDNDMMRPVQILPALTSDAPKGAVGLAQSLTYLVLLVAGLVVLSAHMTI